MDSDKLSALPQAFLHRMEDMLGDDFEPFLAAYEQPRTYGLRVNTAKISCEEFEQIVPFEVKKIPWVSNGYFYNEDVRPSRCALYQAGLYYLQEPSAMTPASRIPVEPGEYVLDMCAAPGGKATAVGSALKGEGLLVANDISTTRARALLRNLELFGIPNLFVSNEKPEKMVKNFPEFFHKIILDAPCSGEGMFRKEEALARDWTPEKSEELSRIQKQLCLNAADMLQPGGQMLYSTCTFAKEENEDVINEFISEYENAKLIEMQRIWPHKVSGEGHFVAKIQKLENEDCNVKYIKIKNNDKEVKDYREFEKKFLNISVESRFDIRGENLYLLPEEHPDTKKLKVLRYGLHLGMLKKNRFEPSHALSHYLKMEDVKNVENFSVQDDKILDYLRGNTIETGKSRGWVLVCVEGIGLGWGKESNGILKNHYPKGLRINY